MQKFYRAATLMLTVALSACNGSSGSSATPTVAAQRVYNGTASVGDFITLTVNSTDKTIAYQNFTNGDTGTATYTVNSDGSYNISDPKGEIITGYEVPGYAFILQGGKTGPNHATPSLITAVESGPLTMKTWENQTYNYMQFRTNSGGVEIGSVNVSGTGVVQGAGYSPYQALLAANNVGNVSTFNQIGPMPGNNFIPTSSGTSLQLTNNGEVSTIFGTANGQFVIDTPNGTILGLAQAASAAFNASDAGTYSAIIYEKDNASTGPGNVESGTPVIGRGQLVVDASGNVTVTNSTGTVVAQGALTPVSSVSSLYVSGGLQSPCNGLFTFHSTTTTAQQDFYIAFQGKAATFASYGNPLGQYGTYSYFYGTALQ